MTITWYVKPWIQKSILVGFILTKYCILYQVGFNKTIELSYVLASHQERKKSFWEKVVFQRL